MDLSPHSPSDRPLKGALHTHTTKSDGKLHPEEVLRVYRDLGFDFIALTDHDFLMMPHAYDAVPDEFEDMLIFKGIERTVFARGYLHYNEIHGDDEVIHIFNHPAEYDLTVDEVKSRLEELETSLPIHAMEVSQKGYYTPEFDIPLFPYPKVVSDDSHTREGCGRAWVEVPCGRDKDTILRSIKNGEATLNYRWTAEQTTWAGKT
tara:strand:+ start:971 stop:1585 length:615 start_codon:yes stop_codon:yes gene_type:complete